MYPMTITPGSIVVGTTIQTATVDQITLFALQRKAPVSRIEIDRVCELCRWLDIDAAFVFAVWQHEQGIPLGNSLIGSLTHNPFNIKAYGRWPSVPAKGAKWNVYESWQLGLFAAVMHLKQFYGANKLQSIGEIIPMFAPKSDKNDPASYIRFVCDCMNQIATLPDR